MMRFAVLIAGVVGCAALAARAAEPNVPAHAAFDTTRRVPWTTSKIVGRPDPPLPYRLVRVFESVALKEPLFVTHVPGTDTLLVIERSGRILSFPATGNAGTAELFFDVGEETYSVAFHPKFAENRQIFIFSNGPANEPKRRNRIARYEVTRDAPLRCDPASAHVILEYSSNGHNGGDLAFGPDGMLYISAGDGTADSDGDLTGQDLTDLPSAILRIDVDHTEPGRAYTIPRDNPFVETPEARGEIWAYGLRNPWRIAFEPGAGRLWVGDVGQDVREYIHIIERGGNCGWSVEEGGAPFQTLRKRGPTPIVPPVVFHPHSEARSITGGRFYEGQRLPELQGAYIYGDFATGRFWGVRYDGKQVTWQRELADTALQIVSFGALPDGDLLVVDYTGGLYRFEPNVATTDTAAFPRRLSETGLFKSVAEHEPAAGVMPYSVNSPLWSDGASKERLLAMPEGTQIQFAESRGWNLPDGAVAVKTFGFEMTPGDATTFRRVETRLMVREQGEWTGYSYEWNDEQTDAELVPAAGRDLQLSFATESGGETRHQTWQYPSRAECMMCHSRAANYVLGLSAPQMNRVHRYGEVEENQLAVLERLGMLSSALPRRPTELPTLVDPYAESGTLDARARSYLHANCAHCHVSAGGGNARLELEFTTPLEKTNLVDERPLHDQFGIVDARVVAPAHPERSLLLTRLRRLQRGRMPPLATNVVDEAGARLIEQWIAELK